MGPRSLRCRGRVEKPLRVLSGLGLCEQTATNWRGCPAWGNFGKRLGEEGVFKPWHVSGGLARRLFVGKRGREHAVFTPGSFLPSAETTLALQEFGNSYGRGHEACSVYLSSGC